MKAGVADVSDKSLLRELRSRGFDIEQYVFEAYVRKNYKILDKLGEGASGMVWRVRKQQGSEVLAMKEIKKPDCDVDLQTEVRCLRKLQHRHIVNLVDVVETRKRMWLVMECAQGGNIYESIQSHRHVSEQDASRIVKQVLEAVHYMHSFGVVHRDLKPENVLLMSTDPDSEVKIADFGLAVELSVYDYRMPSCYQCACRPDESMRMKQVTCIQEGYVGSPICMAPEVASSYAQYGPQCDIWSVGCMTHELLTGHTPFNAASPPELFKMIQKVEGPNNGGKVWDVISPAAKDIITKMLKKRPTYRVSAREALHHAWFRHAPTTHMAHAHSNIVRRVTSPASRITSPAGAHSAFPSSASRVTAVQDEELVHVIGPNSLVLNYHDEQQL